MGIFDKIGAPPGLGSLGPSGSGGAGSGGANVKGKNTNLETMTTSNTLEGIGDIGLGSTAIDQKIAGVTTYGEGAAITLTQSDHGAIAGSFDFAADSLAAILGATTKALEASVEFAADTGASTAEIVRESQRGAYELKRSIEQTDTARAIEAGQLVLLALAVVGGMWAWSRGRK